MTDAIRGLHLHVDCASGAAGDMMLGALLDLGVPVDVIAAALDAVGAGRERLRITRVMKAGIAATDVKVDTDRGFDGAPAAPRVSTPPPIARTSTPPPFGVPMPARTSTLPPFGAPTPARPSTPPPMGAPTPARASTPPPFGEPGAVAHPHVRRRQAIQVTVPHDYAGTAPAEHLTHEHDHHHPSPHAARHVHGAHEPHDHARGDHAHHHYADIRKRITDAPLTEGTRRRALDIFDRIARAEAKLHGTTVEAVAFHEVGAIDSVVDVVGTAAALDWLAPTSVSCTSVAMGHGSLHCAHGVLPVPAPASLEVLREAGGVMADGGVARELCTPTGAAILAAAVTTWGPSPAGRPVAVGWGAGDAELADRANVLRLVVLEKVGASTSIDAVWQIDANLDDMSPELCAPAADAIFAAGALDVWWTPITMKKGRPALALSALVPLAAREAVIDAILRETTTIGVRYAPRERRVLERALVTVATPYGDIAIKVARDGETIVNAAPEYEACAAAARTHGVPVKLVYAAALASYGR